MKITDLFEKQLDKNTAALKALIKKSCFKNFMALRDGKAPMLFRGIENPPRGTTAGDEWTPISYFTMPERKEARKSRTESSVLLSFVADSPKWQNVPNRAYSVFASTSETEASQFSYSGDAYLIIPFDSVKHFAWIEGDFNEIAVGADGSTFLELLGEVASIGARLQDLYYRIAGNDKSATSDNPLVTDELIKHLEAFHTSHRLFTQAESIEDVEDISKAIAGMHAYCKKHKLLSSILPKEYVSATLKIIAAKINDLYAATHELSLIDFFNKFAAPDAMGVKVVSGYENVPTERGEVWFEGPYIAFEHDAEYSNQRFHALLKYLGGIV